MRTRSEDLYAILSFGRWDLDRGMAVGLAAFYGSLLTSTVLLAALVYVPMSARTNQSFIFLEDIAAMEFRDFLAKAENMEASLIEHQLPD